VLRDKLLGLSAGRGVRLSCDEQAFLGQRPSGCFYCKAVQIDLKFARVILAESCERNWQRRGEEYGF
jgi:hypothetical protein